MPHYSTGDMAERQRGQRVGTGPLAGATRGWPAAEGWAYPGLGTYTYHTGASQAGAEVVAMRFFGGRAGVLAVSTRPGELLVYRSGNSGATWYFSSVLHTGSLSRPTGFFASKPGEWELPAPAGLYVTFDGGRHWALRRSRQSLSGMTETSFSSPQSGLGFASGPAVGLANTGAAGLRTSDGGRSWVRVQLELPAPRSSSGAPMVVADGR